MLFRDQKILDTFSVRKSEIHFRSGFLDGWENFRERLLNEAWFPWLFEFRKHNVWLVALLKKMGLPCSLHKKEELMLIEDFCFV